MIFFIFMYFAQIPFNVVVDIMTATVNFNYKSEVGGTGTQLTLQWVLKLEKELLLESIGISILVITKPVTKTYQIVTDLDLPMMFSVSLTHRSMVIHLLFYHRFV